VRYYTSAHAQPAGNTRGQRAGRCHFYIWQAGYWRVPCRETLQAFSTLSICCFTFLDEPIPRLSMADEPGTSRTATPPPATATGATPMAMSEAAVRGLIRDEVAAAIAAAFQTPAPRALPPPGEPHAIVHNLITPVPVALGKAGGGARHPRSPGMSARGWVNCNGRRSPGAGL
jgi:hypothetical protein